MSAPLAAIFGWRKPELDERTAAFFSACRPWGFILFAGACKSKEQVARLTRALLKTTHDGAMVFIDQEGGRVARLKPPIWPQFPSAARYGAMFKKDKDAGLEAARLAHRLIAHELVALGIRANCAPCLDVPAPDCDQIVGDRAFSADPEEVALIAHAALDGLHQGGVVGVIKHMPGHGRATLDSHKALPKVAATREELARDFLPFKRLKDQPMAMTAHVLFKALDDKAPTTLSRRVIETVIRGEIGFDGLLMSDDLGMKALSGSWREKAGALFHAGCDVALHCSGELTEMEALALACPPLAGKSLARAKAAEAAGASTPHPFDAQTERARLDALLAQFAPPT